jgi:hypothetical protein
MKRTKPANDLEAELDELRNTVLLLARSISELNSEMKNVNIGQSIKPLTKGKRAKSSRSSARPSEPLYSFYQ